MALEVRKFAKRQIEDLIDTREPQLLAGIVGDFRVINGQRGKLALFKLDDKSGMIDARVDEALMNAHKNLLKEDELIIVMGKVQPDRFSGGMQLTVNQIWDLEQARCRFGKYLRVAVNGKAPDVGRMVKDFPAKREMTEQGLLVRGLPVRLALSREINVAQEEGTLKGVEMAPAGAQVDLQLGDGAKFFPSDAALAGWRAQAHQGSCAIVYD